MAHKVILVADPGIDGAFAITLALYDSDIDLVGLAATAGTVAAEQANRNVQTIVEQLDPPRWPRFGAALSVEYEVDGTRLHGSDGLGGVNLPCAQLHHKLSADKLLTDLGRLYPKEITIVTLGPMTAVARAMDRDPEFPALVRRFVCLGGSWHQPGDIGPVSEFNFFCDPASARQVLRSGAAITLIPLDVSRQLVLAPSELLHLPAPESRACRFLQRLVPFGIGASSNLFGIEGFHLQDVLGIFAVSLPGAFTTRSVPVDVETRGELTRGMSVIDVRWSRSAPPNVELAIGVDLGKIRLALDRILRQTM
jgi:inosine-uridine nucleoside N-ribohydrolase